ncbi:hypothetical protein ACVWZL_004454 [Bradyrhizobium sp. GM2.4]
MVSFASRKARQHAVMSEDFERELTREVLRTELVRVRALITTGCVIVVFLTAIYLVNSSVVQRVWRGTEGLAEVYGLLTGFILFEVWVHSQIRRNLKLDRDLPVIRRYIGALIETSLPTVILILQIRSMGASQALGFVVPLIYFIFVILSTLRLDFWLSTFTGFVAAGELLAVALIFDPASGSGEPQIYFHAVRSTIILICGVLAGAVGAQLRRQFAASIAAATARDRVTNLFGQHVSPQVVERLMAAGTSAAGDLRRVAVMFVEFPRLHRRRAVAHPAGGGRPARRRLRRPGRHSRPRGGHREQVFGRRLSGPVRRAAGDLRRRAPRGRRGPRDADRDGAHQRADELAAQNRNRHPFRRGRRRQYRLAPAQGIHGDRRHRELRLPAGGAEQGVRLAALDLGGGPRGAGRGRRRCGVAWGGRGARL